MLYLALRDRTQNHTRRPIRRPTAATPPTPIPMRAGVVRVVLEGVGVDVDVDVDVPVVVVIVVAAVPLEGVSLVGVPVLELPVLFWLVEAEVLVAEAVTVLV